MTLSEFAPIYALLAVQLKDDGDEATIAAYHRVLERFNVELVKLAAEQLAFSAEWFPKTSEWVQMIERVEHDRSELFSSRVQELHRVGKVICTVCEDTGWRHVEGSDRVSRCECVEYRRAAVLGKRALPGLPA